LPAFLPTLRTLTFIGGEPLADAGVMQFLRDIEPSFLQEIRTTPTAILARART
jgi:hypothetical protein